MTLHTSQQRRHVCAAAAAAVLVLRQPAAATLLASSSLEYCTDGSYSGLTCSKRMVLTASVQNAQNATESLFTYRLTTATDAAGHVYDVVDSVEITLSKTLIALNYPLTYVQQFNNAPTELVLGADARGQGFNALYNPCIDDPSAASPSCGWVIANGQRVQNSQGFCCACSTIDVLGASSADAARGGLDCSLFSSHTQAAHCLRMHPLWYSAFAIGAPVVQYSVYAVFRYCRGGANLTSPICSTSVASISPSVPGACVRIPGRPVSLNSTAAASSTGSCDAVVTLEGDFAAFQSAPDYSSKYLLAPLICEDFARCGNRTLESSQHWMLVDRASTTTTGAVCNSIGVSYDAFNGQGSRCQVPAGSCLLGQPQAMYDADTAAEAAGVRGHFFVRNFAIGGDAFVAVQSPQTAAMRFSTNVYQKTVITIAIDADAVQYRLRVAPGLILAAAVASFEAASGNGVLAVTVANNGSVQSMFTVAVTCTAGITSVPAQALTLPPPPTAGYIASLTFAIQTEKLAGAAYACNVMMLDGLQQVTANVTVTFNTTSIVINTGAQGGSPVPGAPSVSTHATTGTTALSCQQACSSGFDIICVVRLRCAKEMWAWAGSFMSMLLVAALLLKFPWLITTPLQVLLGCLCSGGKRVPGASSPASPPPPVAQLMRRQSFIDAIAASVMLALSRQPPIAQHRDSQDVQHENPIQHASHQHTASTIAV